jgi:signal transduction histidine kinase
VGSQWNAGGGRWLLSAPVVALLLIGAVIAWLVPEAATYVGFVGLVIAIPLAIGLFYFRSKPLPPRERTAWRFVALGLLLFWLGVVIIGILNEMGVDLPAFGPLDVFFITAYVAIIVALYKLTRMDSGGREWVLTIVDALVGGIALAALIWNAFFAELMASLEGATWWEATIAAVYPVVDIVVVTGLLILVLRRSNYHLDLRLVFFALGGAAQVLGDLVFLSRSVGESFAQSEPAYYVNLLAIAFMLLSATIVDRVPRKREFPEAPTPFWALMWPYILAAVLVVVHFENYRRLAPGSNEILLLDAVILIGMVILVRQVYVIYRDRNRVDRKRAELVASVSHELRTPLTAMVGFLSLLDDHPDEFPHEARQEMIGEAADQARHMSRLVSDLLVLARGDHTLLAMEREDVRAMAIVLSVLRNLDTGTTRIEEDLDAEVRVHVDPDRIKQALANLISNAVRYGGDRCLVVARVVGRDLVFEIHDNGEGVPTRYESIIWQHFERGAHRLDAVTPGLGIGLSIVQAVMEAHGGRADYRRSERLGGACFTLTIPGCVLVDEPALQSVRAN